MEEKETKEIKESKVKQWLTKYEVEIATLIATLVFLLICLFFVLAATIPINSEQTNEKTIGQNDNKMAVLQEMYHENSMDIVIKTNALIMSCRKMQTIRDSYKEMDIEAIDAYLEKYDLSESSDLSDERFDLEVDAFVYIFKDELVLDDEFNILIQKREFLEDEMRETEGKIHE